MVTLAISGAALLVSLVTAWVTVFRRGILKATWPSVIYFGPDPGEGYHPKVFLRFLIFTGDRSIRQMCW